MELTLRFEFNNGSYGNGFIISNPPVLPTTGEMVDIDWAHYLTNNEQIKTLCEVCEDHSFIAEILNKKYSPEKVEVLVILHRDDSPEVNRMKRHGSLSFG